MATWRPGRRARWALQRRVQWQQRVLLVAVELLEQWQRCCKLRVPTLQRRAEGAHPGPRGRLQEDGHLQRSGGHA